MKKKTKTPRRSGKADAEIHVIRIDEGGNPDRSRVTVDVGDQIHWVRDDRREDQDQVQQDERGRKERASADSR